MSEIEQQEPDVDEYTDRTIYKMVITHFMEIQKLHMLIRDQKQILAAKEYEKHFHLSMIKQSRFEENLEKARQYVDQYANGTDDFWEAWNNIEMLEKELTGRKASLKECIIEYRFRNRERTPPL